MEKYVENNMDKYADKMSETVKNTKKSQRTPENRYNNLNKITTTDAVSFLRKQESRRNLNKFDIILDSRLHGNDRLVSFSEISIIT